MVVVAAGVVIGFPLLTLALKTVPSSYGAVVVGLLPAATAVMGLLRGRERPTSAFWLAALVGLCAIVAFCAADGLGQLHIADALLLADVLLAALGYAEGALLAPELGSWQVICWALLLSMPVVAPLVFMRLSVTERRIHTRFRLCVVGQYVSWLLFLLSKSRPSVGSLG